MMNELIEQIGGRKRISEIANLYDKTLSNGKIISPDAYHTVGSIEITTMARALIAVLDAQGKPPKELYNLEHFISFFIKVKAGLKSTPNDIDHTIWFLEGLSALLTPPADSVPDGWKLVPVEPTHHMIEAHIEGMVSGGATRAYRAMIAAAPVPGGDGG